MYRLYIKENANAKELLKESLKKDYNISDYEIIYNEYNKPYFNMLDTIQFNHLTKHAPEANMGCSQINKMFHQLYYSISG